MQNFRALVALPPSPASGGQTRDLKKKRSSPKFKRFFCPKSEIYGFLRPKTGDLPKKKRSSPETEVVFLRKLGLDQKQEGQKQEVYFLLHHYSRGIWCCIRPNFVRLFPIINQRSNPDGGR